MRFPAARRFAKQVDYRVLEQLAAPVPGGHRLHLVQMLRSVAGEGLAGSDPGVVSAEFEQFPAEGHSRRVHLADFVFAGERHAQPVAQVDLSVPAQPLLCLRDNRSCHILHVRDRVLQAVQGQD